MSLRFTRTHLVLCGLFMLVMSLTSIAHYLNRARIAESYSSETVRLMNEYGFVYSEKLARQAEHIGRLQEEVATLRGERR